MANSTKYKECINHFSATFKDKINEFPKKEGRKIYLSKYLELIKLYIYEKRLFEAIKLIMKERINIITLLKYFGYLVNRKYRKSCYGFKF